MESVNNHSITKEEELHIHQLFNKLMTTCKRCNESNNAPQVKKAFEFAYKAHSQMRRYTGEPYIEHPLNVALIVANEVGLGVKSVMASILHDIVGNTEYTIEYLQNVFGDKVTAIIERLHKITTSVVYEPTKSTSDFRTILLALAEDVRVVLIRLADRLHKMRTLAILPREKQIKLANETMFLYAPLAHRLGLYGIKSELENLSFKYLYPETYAELDNAREMDKENRERLLKEFSKPIVELLKNTGIDFTISSRPKSVYSTWKKMKNKGIPLDEVYDNLAIRIVFRAKENEHESALCWQIYGIVTSIYNPKPDRIRDWISRPKSNGYTALHGTVMGPEGNWVEVQIRSQEMNEIAEKGFAAHWKYKYNSNEQNKGAIAKEILRENELEKLIFSIREILESKEKDAIEFFDNYKLNLFSSEIAVFTPSGEIVTLPVNATIIDFAFALHSKLALKCIGAKVNHTLVPPLHVLKSGDQVEIITSQIQQPNVEWIDKVVTAKAKLNLRIALKNERLEKINEGRKIIEKLAEENNRNVTKNLYLKLQEYFKFKVKEDLEFNIGLGNISVDKLLIAINKRSPNKILKYWQLKFNKTKNDVTESKENEINTGKKEFHNIVSGESFDSAKHIFANCCKPTPGVEVHGFQISESLFEIHRADCTMVHEIRVLHPHLVVPIQWKSYTATAFLTKITLKGVDRIGILNDITSIISAQRSINIRSANIDTTDGIFSGYFELYIRETDDLKSLMRDLKTVVGINKVEKIVGVE